MTLEKARTTARLARERLFAGVPDEDVQLALAICQRYGLDPLLRHVVLIPGGRERRYNVYITRDGLLHVAHASGKAWSLEVEEPKRLENPYTGKPDIYLRGRVRVHDPVSGREQVFEGGVWFSEYAQKGGAWATHPAAMHQKVLEVYLLRRAFDVALTPVEEVGVDAAEAAPVPAQALPAVDREKVRRVGELVRALGLSREDARRLVSLIVEREVGSFLDLDALEVDLVIGELSRLVEEMDGLSPGERHEVVLAYLKEGRLPEVESEEVDRVGG
ncbi:hypothetical protein TthSNM66_18480 [Thermus thermophilus]|uniref:hypothetical protein n=1 Tax=Thermus thermophilus TaxID=274 RepID=UPI00205A0832|nr:hypothetical protein [Thermus thermophilus]BDG27212.1 hypothetical protein TthSNM66_18480 [Thermus thermophilus]